MPNILPFFSLKHLWPVPSFCGRTLRDTQIGICCLGRQRLGEGAGPVPNGIMIILGMHNQDAEETMHTLQRMISLPSVRSRASYILRSDCLDRIDLPVGSHNETTKN